MTDDCQQTSDSDNERLTTDDERRTTDDDMAKRKHDIRNWCPRQHKRWCTQHKKVHVSTTKQRSSMYGSAAQTQIQQQLRRRDNTCNHMYTQRHKYSSSYDEEITRAGAGTTSVPSFLCTWGWQHIQCTCQQSNGALLYFVAVTVACTRTLHVCQCCSVCIVVYRLA